MDRSSVFFRCAPRWRHAFKAAALVVTDARATSLTGISARAGGPVGGQSEVFEWRVSRLTRTRVR